MLSIRDLHAYYGKSHVLQGVDLEVRGGEVVALLGRNGVGRSTLAKAVMGVVAPVGAIDFRGQPIAGLPKHRIARLGLGYIPEDRAIFNGLTVRENLGLGLKNPRRPARYDVDQMLDMFPNLRARADTDAAVLSGGEKQMLAMCRTLIGDPALIIIDEPTEGLAPKIVQQIGDMIAEIARLGVSILLIEQKLSIALRIARRVYVMGHGEIVYEGTPARFAERDDVRREWLEV
ncbi:MAG: ABC transporter ATP-binding protein [Pseudomonadota bacterium]|nr:ABC transporter ATP-binding protein [Pseudomonadota bacterium]